MKIVAMVPIKLNNQRLPGKNTKTFFDGKALVTVFLETLLQVKNIDEIYVFCSNQDIENYMPAGVKFLKRSEWLDTKEARPQDILAEFINKIEADVYGMCHCTSPFVTPEHIEQCVEAVVSNNYDSSFTAEKIQRLLWNTDSTPFNFDPADIPRTQDLKIIYSEVSAAYFFKKEVFLKMKRRIGINPYIVEVSGIEAIDIDYPEDFEVAEAVYKNIIKPKK